MARLDKPEIAQRGVARRPSAANRTPKPASAIDLRKSSSAGGSATGASLTGRTLTTRAPASAEMPAAGLNGALSRQKMLRSAVMSSLQPQPPGLGSWQFLCLAEIENFPALRRHIGRARADGLADEMLSLVQRHLPHARLAVVGRALVEVIFEDDAIEDGRAAIVKLERLFEEPVDLDGETHHLDMRIGMAAGLIGTTEDIRLIEEAELALDQARAEHRSVLRDLAASAPAFDKMTLRRELAGAVANGEMFLQYQPKVHVRRQQIASVEALVRWRHPTRGLVLPGDFIPVAEETGDIDALTLWTLDQVIADQKLLAADGHDLTIFINISGRLLSSRRFVNAACEKVAKGGAKIGFEITETAVIRDPDSAIAHLRAFADAGIPLAIDDYGAGLSSLAYLKQLPAQELKIDKMFVLQLTSSNRDPLIVRSTIDLAHALEMEVTAEGVETQAAMALLTVMGCDMVQGYLVSRPLSLDAFRRFMSDERARMIEQGEHPMFKRPATFWKAG